jgi:uncharacterized protein YxjI
MKLKSKEVAEIKNHLLTIEDANGWDAYEVQKRVNLIWDLLDKKDDKDNIENTESSN